MAQRSKFFYENKQGDLETGLIASARKTNEGTAKTDIDAARMEMQECFKELADAMKAAVQNLADGTKQEILLWNDAGSDLQTFLYNELSYLKASGERIQNLLESALYFADELKQEKAVLESRIKELVETLQEAGSSGDGNSQASIIANSQ